jgi:hypothetical protein
MTLEATLLYRRRAGTRTIIGDKQLTNLGAMWSMETDF